MSTFHSQKARAKADDMSMDFAADVDGRTPSLGHHTMDDDDIFTVVLFVVCAAAAVVVSSDGRRNGHRQAPSAILSILNNVWEGAVACSDDGWNRKNLRVSRPTFEWIVTKITTFAELNGFRVPGENTYVDFNMAVAMMLQYLFQESGFQGTAA